ncbi:MAG TPA: lipid II flippase MurJ [Actinoplanes sp.]|nr:lipid II flippase MurJ [Actinoplanes sp.]
MSVRHGEVREATNGLIARATTLAAALTIAGAVLGLLRDLLLARFFGATGETDAFLVAWTVPETASPLLIEGAMTFLMVPIFVRALAEPGGLGAVVRATLPRIAVLLAITAGAVALAAPVLVAVLAPGLAEPDLAVRLMRITAVTVLTFGLAGYVGAALRSAHVFGWPASIYVAYNVGILGSMMLLHKPFGVLAAALGVALGSLLMVLVQAPAFLRRLEPAALLGRVGRPHVALIAFVPIAVYTVTRHAQVFVERVLGSELSAGTISHLNYAQKVAQVPMMLSIMVVTVTFPMLARSMASGDAVASRERLERDLRLVAMVVLAAAAYLIAFAPLIIQLLFQHGAFTAQDTSATAGIMRVYAFGLLGQAAVGVLSRSYFSERGSIWYPASVMAAGLATTAVISVALLPLWNAMAIAAGNAAGITLTAVLMLRGLRSRVVPIQVSTVLRTMGGLILIAGAAGAAGWVAGTLMSALPVIVTLILGAVLVGGTFVLLSLITGVEEMRLLTALIGKVGLRKAPVVPAVLMYHAVDDEHPDPYRISVSPRRLAAQMRWLEQHGLRGTSMRELLAAADRGSAAGLVGLTFDDGYAEFSTRALPVLARHGFTATVFVVAGKLGGRNDWDEPGPTRPLMTAEEVREAARAGIEIGCHGLTHRRLVHVDAGTLDAEVCRSREILESVIGAPVRGFCFPYGEFSDDAVRATRAAGYDYAVGTRKSGRPDRHALPRIYAGERDGAARLWAKMIRHRIVWRARR